MSRGKLSEITLFGVNKHIFGYQSDALRLLLSVVRHLLDHFSLFTMSLLLGQLTSQMSSSSSSSLLFAATAQSSH